MFRRFFTAFLAFFLLPTGAALAAPRVVATVPDLGAIAREVGRDKVSVVALVGPTQDPHFVDARPNLALELSKADLLVYVGLELEQGWLPTLVTGSRNPRIQPGGAGSLDASTLVTLLDVPTQKLDRAMGDVHPGGNPHYLYDPRNAAPIARGIAKRLGGVDPANAATYTTNAEDFVKRLDAARVGWEKTLAPLRGKEVVTYHKSMPYLASWLGFTVPICIEPKPGIPPSPSHVATVLSTVQTRKVKLLLQESYYPETTAQLIQSRVSASLVRLAGGADLAAGQTYIQRIDVAVKQLADAIAKGV
jgi:zinc/manganese transport system substrate-binding protein